MKPTQTLLPWLSIALAITACLVSIYALGRTYVLSTNLSVSYSSSQTSSTPYTSSPYPSMANSARGTAEPTSSTIPIPKDLVSLGYDSRYCPEASLEIYLQTATFVLLQESCGGGPDRQLWEYTPAANTLKKRQVHYTAGLNSPSPDQRFQITLGPADADGEVRKLLVRDFFEDTEKTVALLPKSLSYTETISEYYGSPIGGIEWQDTPSALAYVDVYDSKVPLAQPGDWRLPVLKRPISP